MSLGGSSNSRALHDTIQYAYSNGVFLVAAAGSCSTCIAFPADYAEVVSVGATDKNDAVMSNSSTSVDIFAPGESIYSTVPGGYTMYYWHVDGHAARRRGRRHPDGRAGYYNRNVLTRLRNTAQPVTNCSRCRLLDVAAAVGC